MIKVSLKFLKSHLKSFSSIMSKKQSYKKLNYIRLFLESKDNLLIQATNLETYVSLALHVEDNITAPIGSIDSMVSYFELTELLKEFKKDQLIELSQGEKNGLKVLFIKIDSFEYSLNIDSELDANYLNSSQFKESKPCLIQAKYFKKAIESVEHAVSFDETRLFINTIKLEIDSDNELFKMISTDGYRLAVSKVDNDNFKALKKTLSLDNILIPRESIKALLEFLKGYYNLNFSLDTGENFLILKGGLNMIAIRLVKRDYLKYQAVIPKKASSEVFIESNYRLVKYLKNERIELKNNQSNKKDVLKALIVIKEDGIILVNNKDSGLKADIIGLSNFKPIDFLVNIDYLIDSLESLDSDCIKVGFNNDLSPVLISSKYSFDFRIVMPLKK